MSKQIFFYLIGMLTILLYSCERSTTPDELLPKPETALYQVGGCGGSPLRKAALVDSCFDYTFNEKLSIDFCVSGNCCPDSNRFVIQSGIIGDQITIAVTDTAENLCRCICPYQLHAEFSHLPESSYRVICKLAEKVWYDTLAVRGN